MQVDAGRCRKMQVDAVLVSRLSTRPRWGLARGKKVI